MKKILTLVLAVVMIMAMAVPTFAAETGNVEPAATCTHSGARRTETQITYISNNDSTHNKYRTYVYYCGSCGAYLGNSGATLLDSYTHTYGAKTYVSSSHVGNYTGHYYVYGKTCTLCEHYFTWKEDAACTAHYCVDPI